MPKKTKYKSRKADANGFIDYPDNEHAVWKILSDRQRKIIGRYACKEFMDGLDILDFPLDRIPQIPDINNRLRAATGWEVARVPALIGFDKFFTLLSQRKFPCATFIRIEKEIDYIEEPDIFHELFGHCPMLTHKPYADFMQKYGELGIGQSPYVQKLLARLYWFTVEFGLIQAKQGLRCYGGGILSSPGETTYSLDSNKPERQEFDVLTVLRTPYRINILQPIYFAIKSYEQLYDLVTHINLYEEIAKAKQLGEFEPKFEPEQEPIYYMT